MKRRTFLGNAGVALTLDKSFLEALSSGKKYPKAPSVFIGHGSPMNAVMETGFTSSLKSFGEKTPHPKAVVVISAHWLTTGETKVAVNPKPEVIYDFYGFPEELYKVKYPAVGSPATARDLVADVESIKIHEDHEMGLDHGAWSIMKHIFPRADVPMFQLSLDYSKPPQWHYNLAKELRKLRDRGVMILGSGNVVHNLRRVDFEHQYGKAFDWAVEFDEFVKNSIEKGNHQALIDYSKRSDSSIAHPTNDHYLPLLYSLALQEKSEHVRYIHEGIEHGSVSMRSFLIE